MELNGKVAHPGVEAVDMVPRRLSLGFRTGHAGLEAGGFGLPFAPLPETGAVRIQTAVLLTQGLVRIRNAAVVSLSGWGVPRTVLYTTTLAITARLRGLVSKSISTTCW